MTVKRVLYDWGGLNLSLFHSVNDLHGDLYDRIMLLGTALSSRINFPIYLGAILLCAVVSVKHRHPLSPRLSSYRALWKNVIVVYAAGFLLDCVFLEAIKHCLHYPRPFAALPPDSMRTIGGPMDAGESYISFPSGHASFAMLLAASLWPALGRAGKVGACLFVTWVWWSRVALGVHFPVDVLAGSLSCLLIVLAIRFAAKGVLGEDATKLG